MHRLIILILLIGFVAACSSSDSDNTPAVPTVNPLVDGTATPTATATLTRTPLPTLTPRPTRRPAPRTTGLDRSESVQLRFYNLISEFDEVAVDVSGLRFVGRLAYGSGTPTRNIEQGEYPLFVVNADDNGVLLEQQVRFDGGRAYAGLIIGTALEPQLLIINEDITPLENEETRFNVIHTIPGDDPIELHRDGQPITGPLTFGQQSGTQVITSGRSLYSLVNDGQELRQFELPTRSRTVMTIIIYSDPRALFEPGYLVFETTVPGRADVQFFHMAEGFAGVDLYVNDTLAAANLEYSRKTDRQVTGTGTNQIDVYEAGANPADATPILTTDFNILPGQDLGVILVGTASQPRIIRYSFDTAPVPAETARMTFVHTVPDAPGLIPSINTVPLEDAGPVNYRTVSRSIILEAGDVNFRWYTFDGDQTLEEAPGVELQAGFSYVYFFTGRMEDQPPIIFGEAVGIDPILNLDDEDELGQSGQTSAQVTFINVTTDGTILDFDLGELPIVTDLQALSASPSTPIEAGEYSLLVRQDDQELSFDDFAFTPAVSYTILAYGSLDEGVTLLLAEDSRIAPAEGFALIRMINLNAPGADYQLSYTPNDGPLFRPTPDPTLIAEGNGEFRYPVRESMRRFGNPIESYTATQQFVIPSGTHDLFLIDVDSNNVGAILEAVIIEPGQQYDVVLVQPREDVLPVAFVIAYPLS